jgi:hypothetical protein
VYIDELANTEASNYMLHSDCNGAKAPLSNCGYDRSEFFSLSFSFHIKIAKGVLLDKIDTSSVYKLL